METGVGEVKREDPPAETTTVACVEQKSGTRASTSTKRVRRPRVANQIPEEILNNKQLTEAINKVG